MNNLDIGISLTCYKRPEYLEKVLISLEKAVRRIENNKFILYSSIDYIDPVPGMSGPHRQIMSLISNIDWIEQKIIINNPRIGCNKNTLQAISTAINNHDAVIHLEDDTVLTEDALEFYIHALNKHIDDKDILSVSGYNKTKDNNSDNYYETVKEKFFCCWGCAFWKSKIDIIINNWTNQLEIMNPQSWDSHLLENVFKNRYYQIRPSVSRIQNIGAKNGTYVHDPVWHYYNHRSPFTSDDVTKPTDKTWV